MNYCRLHDAWGSVSSESKQEGEKQQKPTIWCSGVRGGSPEHMGSFLPLLEKAPEDCW
jgi:hypothetical protein